jgi:hypothetical protein
MGFYSDLMQVWPSIFYPLLYPWATGLLGVIALRVAATRRRRMNPSGA